MPIFSKEGLTDLKNLIQQVEPFVSPSDYITISEIVCGIGTERYISTDNYNRLTNIVEQYSLVKDVLGVSEYTHECVQLPFEDQKDTNSENAVLTLRFFLLTYYGIERNEDRDWPTLHELDKQYELEAYYG